MKLSVIVPVYNCKEYLDECLMSILDQLWDDSELIIVDDGSEDGTTQMLERYRDDPQVKLLLRPHEGASGARNTGIEAACGDYIAFVDCDDILCKGFLSESRALLDQNPDLVIFGFERCFLDNSTKISSIKNYHYDASSFADEYIRTRVMLIYSACNKFFNKRIIDTYHIRFEADMRFGEDRLFNYDFLMRAQTIVTSKLIMFHYMQRKTDSMSSRHIPVFFKNARRLHEEKMKCFLTLSKGTSRREREDFVNFDIYRETVSTICRFKNHPEEIGENLPEIMEMIFGDEVAADDEDKILKGEIPEQTQWKHRPCDNAAVADFI